jgi:hypothetical protein
MTELCEKILSVDLDRGWLGSDEQRVLSWACQLFFPLGIPTAGRKWQVVIDDEPVVLIAVLLENPFDLTKSGLTIWQIKR